MAVLKIQEFIRKHENWEELLTREPYYLTLKRKGSLVMFNYSQFSSQPSDIVNEARGLILDSEDNFKVVRCGLFRFYNEGEEGAADIDFTKCVYEEKVDGTLVMFYYYKDKWHMSTHKTFDSDDVEDTHGNINFTSYIECALKNLNIQLSKLNRARTYCFELVSPDTRVCVWYPETWLIYIMERDNTTLEEFIITTHNFIYPRTYSFEKLSEALSFFEGKRGDTFEGFVAREGTKRVKVKNPDWLRLHHFIGKQGSINNILDVIRNHPEDLDEILVYFPENKKSFLELKALYDKVVKFARDCDKAHFSEMPTVYPSKKAFVQDVQNHIPKEQWVLLFAAWSGKAEQVVRGLNNTKLLSIMQTFRKEE